MNPEAPSPEPENPRGLRALLSGGPRRILLRAALVLLWAAGVGLLVWLVWTNREQLIPYLRSADIGQLFVAFGAFLLSIVTAAAGWTLIMRPVAPDISFGTHARIYAATLIARRLPGTLWYVGGRVLLYGRLGVPRSYVAFASGLEMVLFVVSGMLLALVLLPRFPTMDLLVTALVAATAFLLWFSPTLIDRFLRWRGLEAPIAPDRRDVARWILAYCANWISGGLMVAALIRALAPLPAEQIPFVLGAWAFSGAMGTLTIFLPSTFGVVEISLSVFLSTILPLPLAAAVAILTRILTYLFDFLVAAALYPFLRTSFTRPESLG